MKTNAIKNIHIDKPYKTVYYFVKREGIVTVHNNNKAIPKLTFVNI